MAVPFDIVVPAAGTGTRMLASLQAAGQAPTSDVPKQYLPLAGKPVLEHTLARMLSLNPRRLCLVVSKDDQLWRELPSAKYCEIAIGGETRADSVEAGLAKLASEEGDLVLVHDSVRPLVSLKAMQSLVEQASNSEAGAILATPVIDTLKVTSNGLTIDQSVDRTNYWLAQTPQAFSVGLLTMALSEVRKQSYSVTDEASAVEALGFTPKLVASPKTNIKITTAEDLAMAEFLISQDLEKDVVQVLSKTGERPCE